jgi:GNAT superfamily N-acetyltransferase
VSANVRELGPDETALAFEAMRALRPHHGDLEGFVRQVNEVQRPEGYRLVAALPDGGGPAAAVAGFRVAHNLAWGHHVYVDDLSTAPGARRRGLGAEVMEWLLEEARRLDCDALHLDSGFGAARTDAHRLYLNRGLDVRALHFARDLGD